MRARLLAVAALKSGSRVVVPDVANSPGFPSADCLEVLPDAGVRSVQSTRLTSKSGRIWGMLSTHYRDVNLPGQRDLRLIDYLADWAAEVLDMESRAARSHPETFFLSNHHGAESLPDVLTLKAED